MTYLTCKGVFIREAHGRQVGATQISAVAAVPRDLFRLVGYGVMVRGVCWLLVCAVCACWCCVYICIYTPNSPLQ